jgi:hypothetical protein
MSKELKKQENNKIILYQDDNGITNVSVRFVDAANRPLQS